MKHKSFVDMNCPVAQSLEILGERWTLLIIRDAFFGISRFEDFLKTGMSRNVLTDRLKRLVEEGVFEKRPVDGKSSDYRLTRKGVDLLPVLIAFAHWGDKYIPHPRGERVIFRDRESGEPIAPMAAYSTEGYPVTPENIRISAGPGFDKARRRARAG